MTGAGFLHLVSSGRQWAGVGLRSDAGRVRPVWLTYSDVGDTEKLEKDKTLTLRPIMTDRTRPVATGTLLETTGR